MNYPVPYAERLRRKYNLPEGKAKRLGRVATEAVELARDKAHFMPIPSTMDRALLYMVPPNIVKRTIVARALEQGIVLQTYEVIRDEGNGNNTVNGPLMAWVVERDGVSVQAPISTLNIPETAKGRIHVYPPAEQLTLHPQ